MAVLPQADTYLICFPWPPVEAAQSILNVSCFFFSTYLHVLLRFYPTYNPLNFSIHCTPTHINNKQVSVCNKVRDVVIFVKYLTVSMWELSVPVLILDCVIVYYMLLHHINHSTVYFIVYITSRHISHITYISYILYPITYIIYHISYHIISYTIYHIPNVVSCRVVSYIISYHIISCHILYHIISYIISYRIIKWHDMTWYILYYIILYYIILYYIILYYIILRHVLCS